MSRVITIYGGQFGSEGKGEVTALFAKSDEIMAGVRVGGPNAGHTAYDSKGNKVVVQSLPMPSALMGCDAYIGPEGCFIPNLLAEEIAAYFVRNPDGSLAVHLDPAAAIITPEHMEREAALKGRIGSTGEGVGAVTADKVMRLLVTVQDHPRVATDIYCEVERILSHERAPYDLKSLVIDKQPTSDVNMFLGENVFPDSFAGGLHANPVIIIEGTQGYGLSLHTGGFYPFCTSRECTPYALWAGTGINPELAASEKIMVVRTYPIRVGGNSGPLANEITWEELSEMTGGYVSKPEITTVTKKQRRIAELDPVLLKRAILQTSPDYLALTFLDYKFPAVAGWTWKQIIEGGGSGAGQYVREFEEEYGVPVGIISTGPNTASFTRGFERLYHAGKRH